MTARFHTSSTIKTPPPIGEGVESIANKKIRTMAELEAAGMTKYGLKKFNTHYLPNILHDNEHIIAVIYGRHAEAKGILSWVDRMIVATDRRVISLNHKPGYTDIDEFTYDVIDGVEAISAGPFTGVKLNTKISELSVNYVNKKCAERFVHYIEKRRIEYFEATYGLANKH